MPCPSRPVPPRRGGAAFGKSVNGGCDAGKYERTQRAVPLPRAVVRPPPEAFDELRHLCDESVLCERRGTLVDEYLLPWSEHHFKLKIKTNVHFFNFNIIAALSRPRFSAQNVFLAPRTSVVESVGTATATALFSSGVLFCSPLWGTIAVSGALTGAASSHAKKSLV